jgi:ATP synthase protein I
MWQGMGDAWTALSTIIAGIAVWGAIGFGLDRVFGVAPVLMVVGVLLGNFGAIYLIYVRAMNAEKNDGRRAERVGQRDRKQR